MKKNIGFYVFLLGIIALAAGVILKLATPQGEGVMLALQFVLIGLGSGVVGAGAAGIFAKKIIEKNPKRAKEYEIAEKDERNIRIREKAGYLTWYATLFVLAAMALAFIILDNKLACGLALAALFVHISALLIGILIYDKKI